TEAVAGIRERLEQVAHTREQVPSCRGLVLSLPDLRERKRAVDGYLPGGLALAECDSRVELVSRCGQLAATTLQDTVHDTCHRRPRVLLELGSVHQLDRVARERLR